MYVLCSGTESTYAGLTHAQLKSHEFGCVIINLNLLSLFLSIIMKLFNKDFKKSVLNMSSKYIQII